MTEPVSLDVELGVEDVVAPAQKGAQAVDGLLASFDRLEKRSGKGGPGASSQLLSSLTEQEKKFSSLKQHALDLGHSESVANAFASKIANAGSLAKGGLSEVGEELEHLEAASGGLIGGEGLGGVFERLSSLGKLGGSGGPVGLIVALGLAFAALDVIVATELLKTLGELTLKFSEAAAEAGKFAQESRLAMTALMHGNSGEASEEFNNVRAMAVDLGLGVEKTVDQFKELLRAQFDVGQSKGLVKMASDMQAVGARASEVESILLAMSQIKSLGKLQGQDLRQLEQAGISGKLIMEELQKSMHLSSAGAVQSKMQAGGVSADVGIAAIEAAVMRKTGESELGQAGAKFASSTMSGSIAQMKGEWENMMIDAGDAMMPGLNEITSMIKSTFDDLMKSPEVSELGQTLKEGWAEFVDWFKSVWPEIKEAIPPLFQAINNGVQMAIDAFRFLRENWDYIGPVLEVGLYTIGGLLATVGVIGGIVLTGLAVAAEAVALPFEMLGAAIYAAIDLIEYLYTGITTMDWSIAGSTIISGIVDGAISIMPDWLASILGIGGDGTGVAANLGPLQSGANDAGASANQQVVRSGAAAAGNAAATNISNVKGDNVLHLNLSVQAPPGGTAADGEAYGHGVANGIHKDAHSFFGGSSENAA